ncbi:MAG: alkaline phosphatase family protein [Clostridia bacterium]|nr:alkaline phosphatase family protein [Clostridia bacterium]
MKKLIALILASIMMLAAFTACDGNVPAGNEGSTTTATTEEPSPFADYTYKRVVIIGVDGLGAFGQNTDTPNMDRIFAEGATTYTAQTAFPSISAQSWGSMFIGSSAYVHGLNNSIVGETSYDSDTLPTFFKRVRDAMPDAVLASYCDWTPINGGIIEEDIGVTFAEGDDNVLHEDIVAYFAENDPTLFYAHFDSPDAMGHAKGYGSEKHLEQVTIIDGYIGKVYDALVANNKIEDTLFIVTTDHGGTPNIPGDHGGTSEAEMNIFFGAVGKSVKKGSTVGEMNIRDVAAIVLHAFGIDIPEFDINGFSAQVPEGLFEGYTVPERQPTSAGENPFTTLATPAKDSGKYITDFISADKIASVFHFNGNVDDAMGSASATEHDVPKYYGTGYFDNCIEVGLQGFVKMPGAVPAESSYTVSLWFEHNRSTAAEIALLGSHSHKESWNLGFSIGYNGNSINVKIGNGGNDQTFSYPLSEMQPNGWTNFTVVFDKDEGTVTSYLNFEKLATEKYSKRFTVVNYNNSENFILGNDTDGYNGTNIMIDELVTFNSALTAEEIAQLAAYYQYEVK